MRVVAAPDSYKGSVSALGVSQAMERGVHAVFPQAEVVKVPIADGGEGTVEALVTATNGRLLYKEVTGPMGQSVNAVWGILGDGKTAVMEMAACSGLPLVPSGQRDPRLASTIGTGQLMKEVLDAGLRRLVLGVGGSATNDGGMGMATALGARFLDASGKPLPAGGGSLGALHSIDLSGLDPRVAEMEIQVACDVDNPLCGPRGASAVFGPQKGATPEMVAFLDKALEHFGTVAARVTGRDVVNLEGAGAAGGLGAGLMFFTPASLRPGVAIVLEATKFSELVANADLVITGEGHTDFQTAYGKAPVGVAKVAKQYGVPVVCLAGGLGKGHSDVLAHGIDGVMGTPPSPMTLEECMEKGEELIQSATERLCRVLKVGMGMQQKNKVQ